MWVVNEKTKVRHRDPGCTRIGLNRGAQATGYVEYHSFPTGTRSCSYCYSAAGYDRYPGGPRS